MSQLTFLLHSFLLFLLLATCALSTDEECPVHEDISNDVVSIISKLHTQHFYIGGQWVKKSPRRTIDVINPSDGLPLTAVTLGSKADVDSAVAVARSAFTSWSLDTSPSERRSYIEKLLEIYEKREEEMAKLISAEMGATLHLSRAAQATSGTYHMETFLEALDVFRFERTVPTAVDEEEEAATTLLMDPVGVVAMITPWNWPMSQIILKVIPALAVGCTCILKPSELAPLNALLLAEMIDEANFPAGVFNLVNGDGQGVGAELSSHPDVDAVSFTGSTRAGALVTKAAADTFKRVSLELGGKGANIIFADVGDDLEEVVKDGVHGCYSNNGQSCNAPTRMLVERNVYTRAVDIAKEVAEGVEVKSALEEGYHIGPVVSEAQFDKIQGYIQRGIDEGARLVAGGLGKPEGTNDRGFYVKPTVFADCVNSMTIMQEEIFGPVLCIAPFDTEEEALEIANGTPYGLTNYLHSSNEKRRRRFARALRSGMVEMNGEGQDAGAPFGGMKASGNAREGGVHGLEEYCVVKAVTGWHGE